MARRNTLTRAEVQQHLEDNTDYLDLSYQGWLKRNGLAVKA